MKLFSISVKELYELDSVEEKADVFFVSFVCLFVCLFHILKVFSWDTDLWISVGDFTVKTHNWAGKSVFNKKLVE